MQRSLLFLAPFAVVGVGIIALHAQEIPSLPADARVRVTAEPATQITGRIVQVTADSFAVAGETGRTHFLARDQVDRIETREPRSRGRGALIGPGWGALVGGAGGAVFGLIVADYDCPAGSAFFNCAGPGESAAAGTAIFGVLGGGVGAAVGALRPGERWSDVSPDRLRIGMREGGAELVATFAL